ncbi:hypothetical protein JCM3766R1_000828, partial [Sporobolomyces carnicolor]
KKKKKKSSSSKKAREEDDSHVDVTDDATSGAATGEASSSGPVKTKAQLRFEEVQRQRLLERAKTAAAKSHKDRVAEFNEKLEALSEHHDVPKLSITFTRELNPASSTFFGSNAEAIPYVDGHPHRETEATDLMSLFTEARKRTYDTTTIWRSVSSVHMRVSVHGDLLRVRSSCATPVEPAAVVLRGGGGPPSSTDDSSNDDEPGSFEYLQSRFDDWYKNRSKTNYTLVGKHEYENDPAATPPCVAAGSFSYSCSPTGVSLVLDSFWIPSATHHLVRYKQVYAGVSSKPSLSSVVVMLLLSSCPIEMYVR